jgi:hypothetical protein
MTQAVITPRSPRAKAAKPRMADTAAASEPKGKIALLVGLLRQPDGATIAAMTAATGWQAHSVRGALSGAIKKGLGLAVVSEKTEAGRVYRIAPEAKA